jgi:hypothetical protein
MRGSHDMACKAAAIGDIVCRSGFRDFYKWRSKDDQQM